MVQFWTSFYHVFSYVRHHVSTIFPELKRGNDVELADLARGMRKNDFLSAWKIVFCKAGLVWVSWEQCGKNMFLEPEKLFLQSRASLSFIRAVRKKNNFLEPEKLSFFQSRASLSFIREVWKKRFFRAWKIVFFAKPSFFEFHKRSVEKNDFFRAWKIVFFAKPSFSEFHKSSAEKNNFLEPEKLFFSKAGLLWVS